MYQTFGPFACTARAPAECATVRGVEEARAQPLHPLGGHPLTLRFARENWAGRVRDRERCEEARAQPLHLLGWPQSAS